MSNSCTLQFISLKNFKRCENINVSFATIQYDPYRMLSVKYKEGNNRPSCINQISLVHNHDKAGNICYTRDNADTLSGKLK